MNGVQPSSVKGKFLLMLLLWSPLLVPLLKVIQMTWSSLAAPHVQFLMCDTAADMGHSGGTAVTNCTTCMVY